MHGEIVSLATIVILLVLIFTGIPLAFATGTTAIILTLWLFTPETLFILPSSMLKTMDNYALISVPLFVMMGCILEGAGVVERMFHAMHVWAGRLRGGLAVGTLATSTLLAAMVGVIGAEIVVLGLVCLPAMLSRGYDKKLALGVICAGGSLGTLLPPSIVLIVYGLVAQVSIGKLFMAAILPGLMLASLYFIYVLVLAKRNPEIAPLVSEEELNMSLLDKVSLSKTLTLPIGLIFVVLGSLYFGIATPTETAAIGVLGALIISAIQGKLTVPMVFSTLKTTGRTVAMLTWIFFGASALVSVYTLAGGTSFLQSAISGLPVAPTVTILLMMLILVILGAFIDWIGIVLLTMPIFVPVVRDLGMDPIWFGVLFTMNMQISYLTPPFGAAAFYLKSVAPPDVTLSEIFRSVMPFIFIQAFALALVLFFPEIATWLPNLLNGD